MSEKKSNLPCTDQADHELLDAWEMLGTGYGEPSLEVVPAQSVIRRRGWEMQEEVIPAFVKISTSFKSELKDISGDGLKVWLFIALSINRNTEQAHPGIRTIAEYCKCSQNTAVKAIRELESLGLLTVNREDRKYNIYEIPSYVSANQTASPREAVSGPTASPTPESASPDPESASPGRGLTREPEKQELTYDRKKGLEEAKARKAAQRALKADPLDWFVDNAAKVLAIESMRLRIETAIGQNLAREWDQPKSDWNGYEKELIKREKETGQTIEGFMEWFNEDEFLAGNQRIWIKPSKIERWWPQAYPESDPENAVIDPDTGWGEFDFTLTT